MWLNWYLPRYWRLYVPCIVSALLLSATDTPAGTLTITSDRVGVPDARYDFNGDGKPDYVLYNASTRRTVIWYLNNAMFVSGALGPILPVGWRLVDVADFNGDHKPDY